MICSVFVVFFLQNCLCIKFSFLKPTFKKSKNLLVICGSPRHSDWLLPRRTAQCRLLWLLFPWPAPGVKNPVQGQRCFLIFDSCGECMEFLPPEEKSWVFWNGRAVLSALSFQSPLLRVGSASYGKGKDSAPRTSVQWALSSDTCRAADTAAAVSPMEAGRSRSQNRALAAHTTPRGRPRTKQIVQKK